MGAVDEEAERRKYFLEAAGKYPFSDKTSCSQLNNLYLNIQVEIDELTSQIAAGSTDRVGKRIRDGYAGWRNEIQKAFNGRDCIEQQTEADIQASIGRSQDALASAAALAEKTSKASKAATYVIWGMLGLVVVVAAAVFYKKFKSSKNGT